MTILSPARLSGLLAAAVTLGTGLGTGLGAVLPGLAHAQAVISREVVQPLPSEEVQRLNRALVALAQKPRDLDALVEAGTAALGVEDLEAAVGFFGRAADIDPAHPRVALGLAAVYLRSGRPGEALPQFDRAQAAGVPEREMLSDQALALDMVGNQPAAQKAYDRAIALDPGNDEARRRLAVSEAIAGNRVRFEETLRPLLDKGDTAALRARAFGLAILGDQVRAAAIVEQVMPRDLASRIVPYLAYMPRLTPAQQAAAANLGIFPRAADIGREDPRLARLANEARLGSRLAPAGAPLDQSAPAPIAPTPIAPTPAAPTPVAPTPVAPAPVAPASVAPVSARTTTGEPPPPSSASTPDSPRPARVADAFADLGAGELPDAKAGAEAVDLTRITIKRETPLPPKAKEPAKPAHPSRIWVQLATGRQVDALAFDWRRLSRRSDDLLARLEPHTVRWGAAHRLLAGPIASRDKAQALVRALKAKGLDTFLYVSPEGEQIQKVK